MMSDGCLWWDRCSHTASKVKKSLADTTAELAANQASVSVDMCTVAARVHMTYACMHRYRNIMIYVI